MNKPPLELADVVRRFAGPYEEQFGPLMLPSHRRALQDIAGCMTEAMGGGRYHCHDCNETFWSYHGCRNRSCPKCHGRQMADWLTRRSAEILPCRYFHLVATVPSELRTLFLRHQKTLYSLLMKTAAESVRDLAAEDVKGGGKVRRVAGRSKSAALPEAFCENAWPFTALEAVAFPRVSAERTRSVLEHGTVVGHSPESAVRRS